MSYPNNLVRVLVSIILGILLFVIVSSSLNISATQLGQNDGGECPAVSLFCDSFEGNELDLNKWDVIRGTPIVSGGVVTLPGSEIQSKAAFKYGIIQGTITSLDWKPYDKFTDSSFGFEIWTGTNNQCHYAILLKPSGHLAVLRPEPEPDGSCSGDPKYQEFIEVSEWDAIRASSTVTFTLTWVENGVTLNVDDGGSNSGQASYTGLAIPTVPLRIRLYAHVFTISASDYPFQNTGISVATGDQLEFSASGRWQCGGGWTGPNGTSQQEPNSPVPSAGLCALVGMIGDVMTPTQNCCFFVGSANQITASKNGMLYLGSNDNLGKCDGINDGSCYNDNSGTVSVMTETYSLDYVKLLPLLTVTKQADPDLVQAGSTLTYTITITNIGNTDLHATVTDTLPTQIVPGQTPSGTSILPGGTLVWTPTITAPGGVWEQTVIVTTEIGYAGPLTNVVRVATLEGPISAYTKTVDFISYLVYLPIVLKNP